MTRTNFRQRLENFGKNFNRINKNKRNILDQQA
jgi:hypothetical protein